LDAITLENSVESQKSAQALDLPGDMKKTLITHKVNRLFSLCHPN